MGDDLAGLESVEVVLDSILGDTQLCGQSLSGDFGIGNDGIDDGLGNFADVFSG